MFITLSSQNGPNGPHAQPNDGKKEQHNHIRGVWIQRVVALQRLHHGGHLPWRRESRLSEPLGCSLPDRQRLGGASAPCGVRPTSPTLAGDCRGRESGAVYICNTQHHAHRQRRAPISAFRDSHQGPRLGHQPIRKAYSKPMGWRIAPYHPSGGVTNQTACPTSFWTRCFLIATQVSLRQDGGYLFIT